MAIRVSSLKNVGDTSNVAVYSAGGASFQDVAVIALCMATGTAVGSMSGVGGGNGNAADTWTPLAAFDPQAAGSSARVFLGEYTREAIIGYFANIDYTGDNATGCAAVLLQVQSHERPMTYIRQVVQVQSVGANPVLTFPNAVDSASALIAGIFMGGAVGNLTAPQSWITWGGSYATPTTGMAVAWRNTGASGNSFTFSTGAVTGMALVGIEIWGPGAIPSADPCGMTGLMGQ